MRVPSRAALMRIVYGSLRSRWRTGRNGADRGIPRPRCRAADGTVVRRSRCGSPIGRDVREVAPRCLDVALDGADPAGRDTIALCVISPSLRAAKLPGGGCWR
ncbi:hypothetical protein GCM10010420_49600 [Streptomyces glaucosporus]|uniref:Uncharacterized protein n=1 Tax=Streptomyces glaucosporus TaxID=284044 RepID=A0ABN3IW27_9ACTN